MKKPSPFSIKRPMRLSPFNLNFTRRPITDSHEKRNTRDEMLDNAQRVLGEKKAEKERAAEKRAEIETAALPAQESEEGWKPPRTLPEFQEMVDKAHPDWPLAARAWQAKKLLERHGFIERAFLDGLAIGRRLREQAQYKHGWWWDSLQPLEPQERTFVLDQVRRVVMR